MKQNCFLKSSFLGFIGVFVLGFVFLLFLVACEPEKVDINFAKIYIYNSSDTGNVTNQITNVQVLNYDSGTMETTVNNMASSNDTVKSNAFRTFVTDQNIFQWENDAPSLTIHVKSSYLLFRDDCGNSIIIRIENSHTNITEYSKKYEYTVFDPIACGYDYIFKSDFK